ncbi:MAG: 16S rRNA (cytidine(1402)-2'-O)-methyltransferase [Rikenellaceae bacterium]
MSKLYIVPTPIGNLDDITLRAVKTLESVDTILCEDTRTSSVLLSHLSIKKPLWSYHKFNEHQTTEKLVEHILSGMSIALISDAGTPGISDPGFLLVRECVARGVEVQTLPGATAFVPALVNSGFPCDKFCFEGFLPQKKGKKSALEAIAAQMRTSIFYESPHRIIKTLEMMQDIFSSDTQISVSREISKKFEQTVRGTAKELTEWFENNPPKGEFVVVVEGAKNDKEPKEEKEEKNSKSKANGAPYKSKYAAKQAELNLED